MEHFAWVGSPCNLRSCIGSPWQSGYCAICAFDHSCSVTVLQKFHLGIIERYDSLNLPESSGPTGAIGALNKACVKNVSILQKQIPLHALNEYTSRYVAPCGNNHQEGGTRYSNTCFDAYESNLFWSLDEVSRLALALFYVRDAVLRF